MLESLRQWQVGRSLQPTGRLDLCFALYKGPASFLARPIAQDSYQIRGASGWPSCDRLAHFRHSVSAWGKEASVDLEDVKTLLRHEDIATTSNVKRTLGMDAKRRIQQRLVECVKRQAAEETSKSEAAWRQNGPVTLQ